VRDLEHVEGVALARWAERNRHVYPELKWLFHIPNGGARHRAVAAKLKAEGVKKGGSDYLLPAPRSGFCGLFIELKAGKNRPTKEQKEFIDDMRAQGYRAEWRSGWEACRELIVEYLTEATGARGVGRDRAPGCITPIISLGPARPIGIRRLRSRSTWPKAGNT